MSDPAEPVGRTLPGVGPGLPPPGSRQGQASVEPNGAPLIPSGEPAEDLRRHSLRPRPPVLSPRVRRLLAWGIPLLALVLVLALHKVLGCVATRMTVAQYLRHKKEGSWRRFVLMGTVSGTKRRDHAPRRAGIYEVHFTGGMKTTINGREARYFWIDDGSAKGIVNYDPTRFAARPRMGDTVEVTGSFQTINVYRLAGRPGRMTIGVASDIRVVAGGEGK